MRRAGFYWFLAIFFISILIAPSFAVAAENTRENTSENTQQDAALMEDPSPEQIKEAGKFLNACNTNEAMRERHNCKCLSLQFLEQRVLMGNRAKSNEIMPKIRNTCLKGDEENIKKLGYGDLPDIPEEILEEGDMIYKDCINDTTMRTYHDCRCIAGKFIMDRERLGPVVNSNNILAKYQNDCKNEVDLAGYKYSDCMGSIALKVPKGLKPKPFCECYAREYVRINSARTTKPDASTEVNTSSGARSMCAFKLKKKQ